MPTHKVSPYAEHVGRVIKACRDQWMSADDLTTALDGKGRHVRYRPTLRALYEVGILDERAEQRSHFGPKTMVYRVSAMWRNE